MGSATARRTTSASLAATGWVVSALPRSFTVTTAHLCNFLRIPKFVGLCKLLPNGRCFRKACFFNDLSESTKGMDGVQGRGLLKRWFVVEKWVVGGESADAFALTCGYDEGLDWHLPGGSQVSKARPGAPFACFLVCGERDGFVHVVAEKGWHAAKGSTRKKWTLVGPSMH
jgi:hypothetical protein